MNIFCRNTSRTNRIRQRPIRMRPLTRQPIRMRPLTRQPIRMRRYSRQPIRMRQFIRRTRRPICRARCRAAVNRTSYRRATSCSVKRHRCHQQRFQGLVNNRPAIVISQPRTQIPQHQQQLMQQIRLQQQQAARLRPAVGRSSHHADVVRRRHDHNVVRQPPPNDRHTEPDSAARTERRDDESCVRPTQAAAAGSRWDAGRRQQLSGGGVAVARIQQSRFSPTYLKFFRLVQPIICDQSAGSTRPPGVDHNEQSVIGSVWRQPSRQLGPTHVVADELHAGPRLRRPIPLAQRRRIHARHSPGPTLSIRRPTIVVGSREIIQFINNSIPSLQSMLRNRCLANVGSVTSEPFFLFWKFPQRLSVLGALKIVQKFLELCAKLSRPAESNEFVLRRQFPTYSSDSYGFLIFFFPSGDLVFVPHL